MRVVFWVSVVGVLYPYLGYPAVLWLLARVCPRRAQAVSGGVLPPVSMIVPVHNEEARIERKIANTRFLRYPAGRLQVIFVSDGSTDRTCHRLRAAASPDWAVLELAARRGKAAALNAGLAKARHEIVVFSDASIELRPEALERLVAPFADPGIGCVSGEDVVAGRGGEALYGRYELLLRRLESNVHSIVGASGSFYAQRRRLCGEFPPSMAPDFLSVLRTVEHGYRAVSEPAAIGAMTSLKNPGQEFARKVRTLIRGMTALFAHRRLLNPMRFGMFAFALWSHKMLRWTVPFCLIGTIVSPLALLDSPFYLAAFLAQLVFYLGALAALAQFGNLQRSLPGRIALYFSTVNAAILAAWYRYGTGARLEIWAPSRR